MSAAPRHPRRDHLASEAYYALVTVRATRERRHAPKWHHLTEPDKEKWRDQADEWAYVLAVDAREEVARRKAAEERVGYGLLTDPAFPTGPVLQPRGFVDRTFVDTFRPAPGAFGARYVIHPDGTVTKHYGIPPARPKELTAGHPTDTRRTTFHHLDLHPSDTGILRRLYAWALTTYPLACHGLPSGEVQCGCDTPEPMRPYGDQSALHPDHRPPADAWLRCVTCRGLYTR